ncbi:auxin-responsive protein SAUR50-like [Impatiens glandulifera]|uniref:auxin-responsive protein SAUR50-like n=1 Tax=Impatiens glandulifera TaxID=253017 RepID=UPI001FB0BF70|nr:auxin-responsive protein SAUR50-like [Impatiens glandulifera]
MEFLKAFFKKWKRMGISSKRTTKSSPPCEHYCCCICCWSLWSSFSIHNKEKMFIPRDVPKGHIVVYVGKQSKRYIINISLLNDPLFQELLDRASEEYDFIPASKICIPCDENVFLDIVQHSSNSPTKLSCFS